MAEMALNIGEIAVAGLRVKFADKLHAAGQMSGSVGHAASSLFTQYVIDFTRKIASFGCLFENCLFWLFI